MLFGDAMNQRFTLPLVLVALVSLVYFGAAGSRPMFDDGDALYAHVAQRMAQTGDWVTPEANGVRFLDKPPMMYWLMGMSYRVFGMTEFAARFPSALAVLGIAFLMYLMGKRTGGQCQGFIAGAAASLSVGTFLFTRQAFPDVFFVFFLTLSMYAFLEWYLDARNPRFSALLFYAALAGAVLTKGLIGVAFPVAIVILFLLWSRAWGRLLHFHIGAGSLLFLALALPWHILAAARNPGFLWYYFVNEQFLRFLGKRQPFDYESISLPVFWGLVLAWFFPWSAFLPSIRHVFQNLHLHSTEVVATVRLALSWALVIFVFFSFSSRIEHYSMPILPPLGLLVGVALFPDAMIGILSDPRRKRSVARGFGALAILGGLMALILIAVLAWLGLSDSGQIFGTMDSGRLHAYKFYFAPLFEMPPDVLSRLMIPFIGTCAAFGLGLPIAWLLNRRSFRMSAVSSLSLVAAAFCFFTFQSLGICEEMLSSRQFGVKLNQIYRPGDAVVIIGDFETANSINFYAPAILNVYRGSAALLQWGMRYPDAPEIVLSDRRLEEKWRGPGRVFLLAPEGELKTLKLKPAAEVMRSAGRILISNR